jgi:hypothetical protein
MPPAKTVATLTRCVNGCAGNLVCVDACENDFLTGPGNSVEAISGGKVFKDSAGGKVFISDSGVPGPVPPPTG